MSACIAARQKWLERELLRLARDMDVLGVRQAKGWLENLARHAGRIHDEIAGNAGITPGAVVYAPCNNRPPSHSGRSDV